MIRFWLRIICPVLISLLPTAVQAHTAPGSAVTLDFHPRGVQASLALPLDELQFAFKHPLLLETNLILPRYEEELRNYLIAHIKPESLAGEAWQVTVRSLGLQLTNAPFDLIAEVWLQPPPDASARHFRFNYSVINHEVMSHYTSVMVGRDWNTALFSGQPEPMGCILATQRTLDVDRRKGSWWHGFHSVFRAGMAHISSGTDHLLFLLTLLLPAPLLASRRRWTSFAGTKETFKQLLKLITAFTLGHSGSLLIGAFIRPDFPARPVEVLIALSVLVSAVHAIRPWFPGKETWIAAGFGLVHGLAFAGSMVGLGFSYGHLFASIFAFNLGIEAMQLMVVAATFPWLVLLARSRVYEPVRIMAATAALLAALGWAANRGLDLHNPFEAVVHQATAHPLLLVGGIAVLAVFANLPAGLRRLSTIEPAQPNPEPKS